MPIEPPITAEAFAAAWGKPLVRSSAGAYDEATVAWLTTAGLPKDAAPFLSFSPGAVEGLSGANLPGLPVGSTGNGDPIVVLPSGAVVALNHDADLEPYGLASSVASLGALLLAYREVARENTPRAGLEACRERLRVLDPEAAATFWDDVFQARIDDLRRDRRTRAEREADTQAAVRADAEARLLRAAAHVAAGDLPSASLIYGDLVEAGVRTAAVYEVFARMHLAAGDVDTARRYA